MVMISRAILVLFFWLFFAFLFLAFGRFVDAYGIDGAQCAQPALAQGAFAFKLGLRLNGETRPRNGFQTALGNGFAGQFANAVGALFDSLQSFLDLIDGVLI